MSLVFSEMNPLSIYLILAKKVIDLILLKDYQKIDIKKNKELILQILLFLNLIEEH